MTNVNEKNSEAGITPENIASAGRTPLRAGDINAYEAAGADLLVARRSSIRSRSTSQYLSAESRSLSCSSQRRDSSGSSVFGPESFAARCSLRLDFARRHLPRRRLAAPVTIVPSFVLFALKFASQFGSGRHKIFSPPLVSTAAELRSFASAAFQNVTVKNECFGSSSYVRGFQQSGIRFRCTVKDY